MTNLEKLIAAGAKSTAGDLILNHQVVGRVRDGELTLTAEGRAIVNADAVDVVIKSETKRPRKTAAKEAAPAEPAPAEEATTSLDDLLGAE